MDDIWTVRRILAWIEGYLRDRGDENPRLSAQWLVSDALGLGRLELYLDPERPLSDAERATLRDYTRRRGAGEPLQYITGTTDFRLITVAVRQGVLIPRPETEVLVSVALERVSALQAVKDARLDAARQAMMKDWNVTLEDAGAEDGENGQADAPSMLVVDLCTGSGCIACSIAAEVPHAHVVATDLDPAAVELARENVDRLGLEDRVQVLQCDLGDAVPQDVLGSADLVISNPPYIPTQVMETLDAQVARYESALALDGGEDGLDVYRRLLPFALSALRSGGVLAVELHETCLDQAKGLALECGFQDVVITSDLAGRPRVLTARKG